MPKEAAEIVYYQSSEFRFKMSSFYSQSFDRSNRQTRNFRSPSPAADFSDEDLEGQGRNVKTVTISDPGSKKTKVTLGEALKGLNVEQKSGIAGLISDEDIKKVARIFIFNI